MAAYDLNAMIRQAAQEQGIDPALYRSLIMAGSSGNANAVSSKGAMGYAQLMPATAAELGVDPSDPAQNLKGGAMYLRQMLERFKDPKLALAAYNAGPSNVEKYNGIPPFAETQNYVSKVLGGNKMENTPTQQVSNDPMGSLSKSQRLMLAFGALKDAGMALQGKDSNSFANTMTGINDQQDQERKRVAAANILKQQSDAQAFMMGLVTPEQATATAAGTTGLLPDGSQPPVVSDGSQPTVAPNSQDTIAQLQNKRRAAMALAASNTQLQPMLPTLLAEIDDQINKAQMSEASSTVTSLDFKSPFDLDALKSKYIEQTLSPSSEVREFAKTMLSEIKEARPIAVLNENAREAGINQIQTIDALITDPDLKIILGVEGAYNKFLKDKGLGFTNPRAADLYSIVDKFKGEAFVTAYQGLKGGGPITDIEGKSATAAQNRVNEATDLPSYLRALEEVRTVVAKRIEKLGGQVPPIPTAPSIQEPTVMPNGVIIKPRG